MLTKKQRDLLVFIRDRMADDGVAPSFDEMKDALDLKSKSGIHRLITGLVERGYLQRLPNRARALDGIPGLGLYLLGRELGFGAQVLPSDLTDTWWRLPMLVISAIANSAAEEFLVVAYLITRLRRSSAGARGDHCSRRRCCAGRITSTRASAAASATSRVDTSSTAGSTS